MHYLHPRSRTTGTLFTTTLAISFLVVALPHLLPCPVDRRQYADTIEMPDGTVKRRRRRVSKDDDGNEAADEVPLMSQERPKRECPVPKPGGLMGQLMGFEQREQSVPKEVVVRTLSARERGPSIKAGNGEG
ncbi:hypothetical protein BAUCODRAFT_144769 [Baudoinia panamericana UAMH 10762]|uniref:Alpha-1,3-mannosyltransferase n=1 Tax=Baudoinia panamericana (strain UAMH 10762) TaxID=717646 RepID=M2M292_BAUPA|nr:uncharacterized protein BAUCODRAFT_144769 [Baudoinia panamericana UAMH 10762]EMD01218.1 hypothetical protein BAUCODRAFT_144769 [Baudoinia panamericana UAMH 10762]